MKNEFKFFVFVLLLIIGVEVKAADGFDVKVSGDKILTVKLEEGEKGAILLFQDNNETILFKESLLVNEEYSKTFNLEVVPNGVYYLNLEKQNSILTTEVKKTDAGLELSGKLSKITFKPLIKVEEKLVKVFLTNPGKNTASFKIYDRKGIMVKTLSYNDLIINKTFDFSEIPAGEYIIEVIVDRRSFVHEIEVN